MLARDQRKPDVIEEKNEKMSKAIHLRCTIATVTVANHQSWHDLQVRIVS
jgi:hypothetical protein